MFNHAGKDRHTANGCMEVMYNTAIPWMSHTETFKCVFSAPGFVIWMSGPRGRGYFQKKQKQQHQQKGPQAAATQPQRAGVYIYIYIYIYISLYR